MKFEKIDEIEIQRNQEVNKRDKNSINERKYKNKCIIKIIKK